MDSTEAPVAGRRPQSPAGLLAYLRRHPVGFWFIFWGELAERCAFYGVRTLLFVYLTEVLGSRSTRRPRSSATYKAGCYLAPLLGRVSRRPSSSASTGTIVGFSIPYVCGMVLMGVGTEYCRLRRPGAAGPRQRGDQAQHLDPDGPDLRRSAAGRGPDCGATPSTCSTWPSIWAR